MSYDDDEKKAPGLELTEFVVNTILDPASTGVRLMFLQFGTQELLPETEVRGRPVIELAGRNCLDGSEFALALSVEETKKLDQLEQNLLVRTAIAVTRAWGLRLTSLKYHGQELL